MSYSLKYFREVRGDMIEANDWYRKQHLGLEKKFSEGIKTIFLKIQSNPHLYAVKYKDVRMAHMRTFPYAVHYFIDESQRHIVIIAVAHHKRNPNIGQQRFE